jgi:serine/threonine protein kinase
MSDITSRLADTLGDRYRIERRLGEGGMATVYLAQDLKHHRRVALKVLKRELLDGNTIYYWQRNSASGGVTLVGARLRRGPPFAVVRTDSIFWSEFTSGAALHPDGQRFVLVRVGDEDTEGVAEPQERFVVVINWLEELRRRRAASER